MLRYPSAASPSLPSETEHGAVARFALSLLMHGRITMTPEDGQCRVWRGPSAWTKHSPCRAPGSDHDPRPRLLSQRLLESPEDEEVRRRLEQAISEASKLVTDSREAVAFWVDAFSRRTER